MIRDFLINNFGLPNGGLYSNLIASGICFILAGIWAHRRLKAHHKHQVQRHEELLKEIRSRDND